MKSIAVILFSLFLPISISAQSKISVPRDWEKFSNTSFSFDAPKNLEKQNIRGKDSFVEEYKNDEITVKFDYGFYGNVTGNCSKPILTVIDRKSAKLCFYEDAAIDKDKPFVTTISLIQLGESRERKLTFWVRSKTSELQREAEKIVRSIEFK